MKTILALLLALVFAACGIAQEDFEMPTDETVALFSFDYSGGFRVRPPAGFVKQPQLQIYSNGRVLRSPSGPDLPSAEFTMTPEQLRAFLDSVVNKHKFYEITAEGIKEAIDATKKRILIADAPNVDAMVRLGRGEHHVSIYAVSFAARQFPEIKALADMAAIEKSCRQLMAVADFGGFENVDLAVQKVNEEIARTHPELPEMNKDQLQFASTGRDGTLNASFTTQVKQDDIHAAVRATYTLKKGGKPTVKINVFPINR